jgi:hypothetical protein
MGASVLLRLRLNFEEGDLRPLRLLLPSSSLEENPLSSSLFSSSSEVVLPFFRFLSGDRAAVDSIEAASAVL